MSREIAPAFDVVDRGAEAASVQIEDGRLPVREHVLEAWKERRLLRPLAARVVVKQYAETKLGRTWLVLRPVADTGGRALVFGGILGVAAPNGIPYFLFLLIGMQAWRVFDRALFWATRSFDRYRRFTRSLDLPLLLLPLAASAPALIEWLVYSGIVILTIAGYLIVDGRTYLELGPQTLLTGLGLVLSLGLAWGLGLWLSLLNARARDVRLSLRYVLELWIYVTPVIYPLEDLSPTFKILAQINPMTPIVEMVKAGLLDAGEVYLLGVAWSVLVTAVALGSGLLFFASHAHWAIPRTLELDEDEEDDATP